MKLSIFLFPNTENGEVYTWGWKECVPSGKVFGDPSGGGSLEKDVFERQSSFLTEQGDLCLILCVLHAEAAACHRLIL